MIITCWRNKVSCLSGYYSPLFSYGWGIIPIAVGNNTHSGGDNSPLLWGNYIYNYDLLSHFN